MIVLKKRIVFGADFSIRKLFLKLYGPNRNGQLTIKSRKDIAVFMDSCIVLNEIKRFCQKLWMVYDIKNHTGYLQL